MTANFSQIFVSWTTIYSVMNVFGVSFCGFRVFQKQRKPMFSFAVIKTKQKQKKKKKQKTLNKIQGNLNDFSCLMFNEIL